MKIGIMQPYFFPYLGYWQLMNAVDRYVVYDDVNFIKGGRINRNAILLQGQAHNINLILSGASPNKHINEIEVNTSPQIQSKLIRTIEQAYHKSPCFQDVMPMLQSIVMNDEKNLGKYLYHSFRVLGSYLGITTEMLLSSELEKDCTLKAYDKVISISKLLGGTEYYNSVNGVPLYAPHRAEFEKAGLRLYFPKMRSISYTQFNNEFVPNLSIIDVMMFNSRDTCQNLLYEYDLNEGEIFYD
ncbi:WbqC-like protein family protein [anaerobic digester metagenome]